MLTSADQIQSVDDLREYVIEVLCQNEQLEVGAFPVTERLLLRAGIPCGMYFGLHGPRALTASAIWETDSNSVLFYDSAGERFQKTALTHVPSAALVAA